MLVAAVMVVAVGALLGVGVVLLLRTIRTNITNCYKY